MSSQGNGSRTRWLVWGSGVVAAAAFAVVVGWTTGVGARVDTNREDIGEIRTEQAVHRTKLDYMHAALGRIERALGTTP